MTKVLHLAGMRHEQIAELIEKLPPSVKEFHLGYTRCAFCGGELGDIEDRETVQYSPKANLVINVHLCDACHAEHEKGARDV